MTISRERPVTTGASPRDESPLSFPQVRPGDVGVVDRSRTRGLGLLASAIAGRRLTVTESDGGENYTDGRQIFIASDSDFHEARDAVALQAALLAAGSLQRRVIRQLSVRRSTVSTRYLTLEAARVGHLFAGLLPRGTVERAHALTVGSRSVGSEESLRRALSREAIPTPPAWVGSLKARQLLGVSAPDLLDASADHDIGQVPEIDDEATRPDDETEESEESTILRLLSVPGKANPISRALHDLLGTSRSKSSTSQGGGVEMSVAGQQVAPGTQTRKTTLLRRAVSAIFESAPQDGSRYPEWNSTKSEYRADWCTVALYDPADRGATTAHDSADSLRRSLARVGLERKQHLRQADGDSLDMSALVDHQVSRQLGDDGDPRIYARSLHTKRDLSVLVLLDSSGSTAEGSEGNTVFDLERQLARSLTEGLESLGDHVAAYGFYSQGRGSVRFLRIKEFTEPFNASALRRLNSLEPSGFTRFGAAIRHAGHLLESHALARNMILIYIGDGLPYDDGYEDGYARADSHLAIRETIQRGVGVIGLAIRSSTEPAVVEEIWSDAPFRVVADTRDARRHVRSMMYDALRMTRSNGRRRDLATADRGTQSQALLGVKRGTSNSYA